MPAIRANTRRLAPGLAAAFVVASAAIGLAHSHPAINATSAAVLAGAVAANLGLRRPGIEPGLQVAERRLLRIAVVLLGLTLTATNIVDLGLIGVVVICASVACCFAGTLALGRALGIGRAQRMLVATGFSICGASAIAAMQPVVRARREEAAVAVALVTLCGSAAIALLPALQGPLGLDATQFGIWAGASVHDVGQTVATASRVPGALDDAVIVKLSRVLLLAPLLIGVGLHERRRAQSAGAAATANATPLPPIVPLFVLGFIAAIALASTGMLPSTALDVAASVRELLLVMALFALGTNIRLSLLARVGPRTLALAAWSWLLIAGVSWSSIQLLGPHL